MRGSDCTLRFALCEQCKRDCTIDLILEGRESLPISTVRRQRGRLLSERTRARLANNVEEMIAQASRCERLRMRVTRPLFEPIVVALVTADLRAVIALLRAGRGSARGVARVERLVTHAASPLYGLDARTLRAELDHVRGLLAD